MIKHFFPCRDTCTIHANTTANCKQILPNPGLKTKTMRLFCEGEITFIYFATKHTTKIRTDHQAIPLAPCIPEIFLLPPKITHITVQTRKGNAKIHVTVGEEI